MKWFKKLFNKKSKSSWEGYCTNYESNYGRCKKKCRSCGQLEHKHNILEIKQRMEFREALRNIEF